MKRGHLVVLNPNSPLFGYYRAKKDVTIEKKRFQAFLAKEAKKQEQSNGGAD